MSKGIIFLTVDDQVYKCVLQGSINTKINILYMLDSLCEASLASRKQAEPSNGLYVDYVTKDLPKIIDLVVPDGRIGLLNLMSATQVCPLFFQACALLLIIVTNLSKKGIGKLARKTYS